MRGLVTAVLASAILLSGCAGGGTIDSYVMHPAEAPGSCSLLPLDSENGRFLQEQFNWTGNPGRVDNRIFSEEGVRPIDNRVALYDCNDEELVSVVLQFQNANATSRYVDGDTGFCEIEEDYGWAEAGIVAGNTVAFVEGDDDIPGMADSLHRWLERVSRQAGVPNPCEPGQGNETNEI